MSSHSTNKARQAAKVTVFGLYRRPENVDLGVCAYCGDPRECLDHVPPLSYAANHLDIDKFLRAGGKFLLFPSCFECNGLLGAKAIDYFGRLGYLHKKYINLADQMDWSEAEISELGHNLRGMIAAHEHKRRRYVRKLIGVENTLVALQDE